MISYDRHGILSPTQLRDGMKGKMRRIYLLQAAKEVVKQAIIETLEGKRKYVENDSSEITVELYFWDLKERKEESEESQKIRNLFENKDFPEEEFVSFLDAAGWKFQKIRNKGCVAYLIAEIK